MYEVMCEDINTCNNDMKSYKSQLTQWMMSSAKVMPSLAQATIPQLQTSSKAAISVCDCGGVKGQCGFKWTTPGTCDGTYGMGQQIDALNAIQIWAESQVGGPVNEKTGGPGLSQGNANAGNEGDQDPTKQHLKPITTSDKAGAGILTALVFIGILGGGVWMII